MANERLQQERAGNKKWVMGAITDATPYTDGEVRNLRVDATSNRLLVEGTAAAGLVTDEYDYIELTYVAAGNGAGEIETVVFKSGGSGGTTVATLTLTYDGSDRLSTVTKS